MNRRPIICTSHDIGMWSSKGVWRDAENGDPDSQFKVGAAEQEHTKAQVNLGYMCLHGRGLVRDPQQAANSYGKAADQGEGMAFETLANLYAQGDGVPLDNVQAHACTNLALALGSVMTRQSWKVYGPPWLQGSPARNLQRR